MPTISESEAVNLIRATNGAFFGVTFVKRTTGEVRRMNARLGVTKHLKGGERAYDFDAKKLIGVYSQDKGDYRTIPFEGIQQVIVNHVVYDVLR